MLTEDSTALTATMAPAGDWHCLVDRSGRIAAADMEAQMWFGGSSPDPFGEASPHLDDLVGEGLAGAWLEQVFDAESAEPLAVTLRTEGAAPLLVDVEIRRLAGRDGCWALATFRRSATAPPLIYDALTGLPDRRAIGRCVDAWRQEGVGLAAPFAALFIDLDDFKPVNDQYGHLVGDAVLAELAARWSDSVRDGDLVTRYGGDEFVVLLKNVATREEAAPIVERLRVATMKPIETGGLTLRITASVGVALSDGVDASLEALIAAADEEMYAGKRSQPK